MSEETLTPQTDTESVDDNFNEINAWQTKDAADRARQFVDTPAPAPAEDPKIRSFGKKVGVTLALVSAAATGAGVATVAVDHLVPGQEVAAATSTVYPGEGIEQSVDRNIAQIESLKIDPADTTERQDVISQAVDLHTDANGIVQPGENVTVIAEKSPIFGEITYKAVADTDDTLPSPTTH